MTLHWWMHWFWVTTLLTLVGSGPRDVGAHPPAEQGSAPAPAAMEPAPGRAAERRPRATYLPSEAAAALASSPPPASELRRESAPDWRVLNESRESQRANSRAARPEPTSPRPAGTAPGAPSAPAARSEATSPPPPSPPASAPPPPPPSEAPAPHSTGTLASDNLTRHELDAETAESAAAEAATAPERRRPTDRPRPPAASVVRQAGTARGGGGGATLDAGAVAGISLAALALATLAGTSGFVLYRRRYLNKPQALNDKCSNPDSSGYLDDSTVRENSEEMYSLDNDSFLNSLEAMTIQNYWTENVKHSKL